MRPNENPSAPMPLRSAAAAGAVAALLALSACGDNETPPEPAPVKKVDTEPVSILRPDVEMEVPVEPLENLEVTISFASGGSDLDDAATAALDELIKSRQFREGGTIELRGHSDAGGSDAANMRASTARAEAVREWLTEHGVDEEIITLIAFGEQNPARPNALPDGTPDEAGRAANRRVDITVRVTPEKPAGEGPDSADTPSDGAPDAPATESAEAQ